MYVWKFVWTENSSPIQGLFHLYEHCALVMYVKDKVYLMSFLFFLFSQLMISGGDWWSNFTDELYQWRGLWHVSPMSDIGDGV